MYKLLAAILLGNGVGGRMATAPHYNTLYSGYITLKTKQIQLDDGLKKGRNM